MRSLQPASPTPRRSTFYTHAKHAVTLRSGGAAPALPGTERAAARVAGSIRGTPLRGSGFGTLCPSASLCKVEGRRCERCWSSRENRALKKSGKLLWDLFHPCVLGAPCSVPCLQSCYTGEGSEVCEAVEVQSMVGLGHILVLVFTLPGVAPPKAVRCTRARPLRGLPDETGKGARAWPAGSLLRAQGSPTCPSWAGAVMCRTQQVQGAPTDV